jgi:DNA excision repair protein ERCC-2
MGACYKNILSKDILYAIAPTGVGKTIATIFSSLTSATPNL